MGNTIQPYIPPVTTTQTGQTNAATQPAQQPQVDQAQQAEQAIQNTQDAAAQDLSSLQGGKLQGASKEVKAEVTKLEAKIADLKGKADPTVDQKIELAVLQGDLSSLLDGAHAGGKAGQLGKELTQLKTELKQLEGKSPKSQKQKLREQWLEKKVQQKSKAYKATQLKAQQPSKAVAEAEHQATTAKVLEKEILKLRGKDELSADDQTKLTTSEAKYDKVIKKLEDTVQTRLNQVDAKIKQIAEIKKPSADDTAELRKLVKERSHLDKIGDRVNGKSGATSANHDGTDDGTITDPTNGTNTPFVDTIPPDDTGDGTDSTGGVAASGDTSGDSGDDTGDDAGTGGTVGGTGGALGSTGAMAGVGGSLTDKDVDQMLDVAGASMDDLTGQIETLMAKANPSEKDLRDLQWKMQKRSELSMLISNIMQMAHDTRKQIIGNIRS